MTMTMKMILMTMKMATIAKLDSGRRFKAVQCPLQPDKDSKLRSNKDEDDCDKCFSCCPRKTLLEPSVQARISHNQFISLCVKAPCWLQEKYKNPTHRNAIPPSSEYESGHFYKRHIFRQGKVPLPKIICHKSCNLCHSKSSFRWKTWFVVTIWGLLISTLGF